MNLCEPGSKQSLKEGRDCVVVGTGGGKGAVHEAADS